MSQSNYKARSKTTETGKNHHQPDSVKMNSKKENSVKNVITRLCQKKNREANVVPIPGKCGYQAIDSRFQKPPFFTFYKILFEIDGATRKSHFALYSHENSWSFTKESTISSLVALIKRVERVNV